MVYLPTFVSALLAATLVSAQHNTSAKLTKPPLAQNLDYLKAGLYASLPETKYTLDKWGDGWIPQQCKDITGGGVDTNVKYNPQDFEIYNVHYADCGDAWVFCHHKQSSEPIDFIASQFSRVPIQMRQWVRHVIDVPDESEWAFEYDGTVTFLKPGDGMITVILHETGHSLDLSGAYKDKPISASDNWWNNYEEDSNVPDPYAQTNAIEDVAQVTVVSVFNENVKGGFGSVEPGWNKIFHQYATLIGEANDAGQGNGLFKPGENAKCTQRLPPSAPVKMDGSSKRGVEDRREAPKVGLSDDVVHVDTKREGAAKHSNCTMTW